MKTKFLSILILSLMIACSSHKSAIKDQGDALVLMKNLAKESKVKNYELDEEKVTRIVAEIDSVLEQAIIVSRTDDIERLEKEVEKTAELDRILLKHAEETDNNRLAISLRELKFRTLVKAQERMDEAFENEETDKKDQGEKEQVGEIHGRWIFKERVSMMLPYMQANERFSEQKTALLSQMVGSLSEIKSKEERRRCWLAIDRMLDEIDVQKSEAGYRPFQRGPYGIFTSSGEVINKLKMQQAKETDEEIIEFAANIINKLEKNLSAKKDGEFWQKVEFSRELQKRLETEGFKLQGAAEEQKEPTIEGLSASEWFDKGYAEENENLKIEFYTKAIELDSQYTAGYNNRGNAYQALGQHDKALADFNKAIELDPDFEPSYINRGNIYQNLGRHEQAIQDFSKAIELETKYTLAYNNRGTSYKNLGRYEEALQDYNKALELNPQYASAYVNRGDVYRKLGKDIEAVQDYTSAIKLDPNYALAYNNRGLSYNNLGKYNQAVQDYKKATEIAPDYAAVFYNLGVVYWTLKKWKDVVKVWEKSLELNPDQSYIIEYLPKAKRQARKMR